MLTKPQPPLLWIRQQASTKQPISQQTSASHCYWLNNHCSDLNLIGVYEGVWHQVDTHTHTHSQTQTLADTHTWFVSLNLFLKMQISRSLSLHPAWDGPGVNNRWDLGGKKAAVEADNHPPHSAHNGCRDLTSSNV